MSPEYPSCDSHEYAVHLVDGRVEKFETVVALEGWIRCIREGPTPRMGFPKATKYYHIDDVERIEQFESE